MAKVTTRTVDRNRFSKKYPLIRAPRRPVLQADSGLEIEVLTVEFNNEESKFGVFESAYPNTDFRVLVSARETTVNDSAQVTLAIDDASTSTTQVKIDASAAFTGTVDVIVLRVVG